MIKHMVEFGAPLPLQSGGNWLYNRVATDGALAASGLVSGAKRVIGAIKGSRPLATMEEVKAIPRGFSNVRKVRGDMLDKADIIGNQRGLKSRIDAMRNPVKANVRDLRKEVDFLPEQVGDKRTRYHQSADSMNRIKIK
jgi:hypothetical protein